ncbi:MAG: DUF3098 domain-containing protein [Flavobacteriales bacterium]|nr:DUF3098 domain-containing protein [Flavobacteriales bacterium]
MSKQDLGLALPRKNYIYIIAGVVVVFIGFVLMAGGGSEDPLVFNEEEMFSFRRITLAPFMVIGGYVLVLWGILKKPEEGIVKSAKENPEAEKMDSQEVID